MTFDELKSFIEERMRMSQIYQPLLIKTLVDANGHATIRQLAAEFLGHDESQLLYYEKRIKEMPVRVLSKHGVVTREGELVSLNIGRLDFRQRSEIVMLCQAKIQQFLVDRGIGVWDHRLLDDTPVSDVLRYRVLKEGGGRCALCGATKDERPLDVDHILPRNRGGKTEYANLQVLCSKCNRSKRDRDDTDFRQIGRAQTEAGPLHGVRWIDENDLAFSILDQYPVTEGHTLIRPKRIFPSFFEITRDENEAVWICLGGDRGRSRSNILR
jgi:ATP adenylyltransferase